MTATLSSAKTPPVQTDLVKQIKKSECLRTISPVIQQSSVYIYIIMYIYTYYLLVGSSTPYSWHFCVRSSKSKKKSTCSCSAQKSCGFVTDWVLHSLADFYIICHKKRSITWSLLFCYLPIVFQFEDKDGKETTAKAEEGM